VADDSGPIAGDPLSAEGEPPPGRQQVVQLERRADDRVELLGRYTEEIWCSTIGATGVIIVRRLSRLQQALPLTGTTVDIEELAAIMGIRPARVLSTIDRLVSWGLVTRSAGGALGVSGYAPLVPSSRLARLPPTVLRAHQRLLSRREG
jgi:hypothetical protein